MLSESVIAALSGVVARLRGAGEPASRAARLRRRGDALAAAVRRRGRARRAPDRCPGARRPRAARRARRGDPAYRTGGGARVVLRRAARTAPSSSPTCPCCARRRVVLAAGPGWAATLPPGVGARHRPRRRRDPDLARRRRLSDRAGRTARARCSTGGSVARPDTLRDAGRHGRPCSRHAPGRLTERPRGRRTDRAARHRRAGGVPRTPGGGRRARCSARSSWPTRAVTTPRPRPRPGCSASASAPPVGTARRRPCSSRSRVAAPRSRERRLFSSLAAATLASVSRQLGRHADGRRIDERALELAGDAPEARFDA